jgi:hypothetical protein
MDSAPSVLRRTVRHEMSLNTLARYKILSVGTVFELPGGVGGVEPPQLFAQPP